MTMDLTANDSSPPIPDARLQEALPYLKLAEADYRTTELHFALQDVLYVTTVVYHTLKLTKERDEAVLRHQESVKQLRQLEELSVTPYFPAIWDLTSEITAFLASRKRRK